MKTNARNYFRFLYFLKFVKIDKKNIKIYQLGQILGKCPFFVPFPQICTTHFIRVKNGKNDFKNPAMGFLKLIHNTY